MRLTAVNSGSVNRGTKPQYQIYFTEISVHAINCNIRLI